MRRITIAALAATALLITAAAPALAAPAAAGAKAKTTSRPCAPKGANVIVRTKSASLYTKGDDLLRCWRGRSRVLWPGDPLNGPPAVTGASITGRYAGFAIDVGSDCGRFGPGTGNCGNTKAIWAVDLSTGKVVASSPGTAVAVAVTTRGRLAWLVSSPGRLLTKRGDGTVAELDSGAIVPRSLRAAGTAIVWSKRADLG
jgi:hypothetical protein